MKDIELTELIKDLKTVREKYKNQNFNDAEEDLKYIIQELERILRAPKSNRRD